MYIRETLTRRIANKTYRSVRLVESRRVGSKVQQKTLLNLGASFPIPKPQWAELVEIIEPKFSSWSLIPASFGWCFHAKSIC